ncbi:PCI-domain-containing protein [Eremomyces bilateralis CBS 781.70]|uniref:Eukaryotic translation initiation factor 3 subunit M n=1 Tax=Eremomyces bilateralis CBS 781.70 TaxID=1392243 RepID=A0A6G1GBV9_9PEZI|nr:PCI-domain-containing protein [Eremomyces bilateralis CBS 781.70]KAF1815578.1 PCI-domain-containing protein [Eremomyces bilateralis CBS 781.70]
MPAPSNTLLIEGSFEELAEELAVYIDNLRKDEGAKIQADVAPLLQQEGSKDEVMKKLVIGSSALNNAPEKEFIAAYNLLIHLIQQTKNPNMFLSKICQYLSQPITTSPHHGPSLALAVLSTIFNVLSPDDDSRYHVLLALLSVIRSASAYDLIKPQLKELDSWIASWELDEDDQRKLYLALSDVAKDSGETDASYTHFVSALRTIPADESNDEESRTLALKGLKAALTHPSHFDFQDLTELDCIQALRKSDPLYFELLEIFAGETLEEYNDFNEANDDFLESSGLDAEVLYRKLRLLTVASLAASAQQTRTLPYSVIAKALLIPQEDVEMWIIDVIRAGLVEGKLSQLNQTFLIHRSTYRVFGEKQWQEVASRLDMWRTSLVGVLEVVRQEKENYVEQVEETGWTAGPAASPAEGTKAQSGALGY